MNVELVYTFFPSFLSVLSLSLTFPIPQSFSLSLILRLRHVLLLNKFNLRTSSRLCYLNRLDIDQGRTRVNLWWKQYWLSRYVESGSASKCCEDYQEYETWRFTTEVENDSPIVCAKLYPTLSHLQDRIRVSKLVFFFLSSTKQVWHSRLMIIEKYKIWNIYDATTILYPEKFVSEQCRTKMISRKVVNMMK